MTPFQALRVWARRAPTSQRLSAAVAAVWIVALLVWVAVPGGGRAARAVNVGAGASQGTGGAGGTSGAPNTTATGAISRTGGSTAGGGGSSNGGGSGATGSGATAGGGTAGGGASTGSGTTQTGTANPKSSSPGGCASLGTDQGVSPTQIRIAVLITDLASGTGNSAFGIPPAAVSQQDFQLAINSVNASGGVACRHIVPTYYDADPIDSSQLQQICLNIVQSGVFAVLDQGVLQVSPSNLDCLPQHKIPVLEVLIIPNLQLKQDFPYLVSASSRDTVDKNAVFALNARGFFSASNGFKKLGFVYQDCVRQLNSEFFADLAQVGLASSQISSYDAGCPSGGFDSPNVLEAAVLQFQEAGVTNVTVEQFGSNFGNFTNIAQQQGFAPKYGLPDDEEIALSYGATHPNYQNIANATLIEQDRYGEERTPGITPSAGTAKCNNVMKAGGQPPTYQNDGVGGFACNLVWMFSSAVDHAPALQRNELINGLWSAGPIASSYPDDPLNFSATHTSVGGTVWRPVQFFESCTCWRVIDPTFHPSF